MDELRAALETILATPPGRLVLSGPAPGAPYKRVVIRRLEADYLLEQYTDAQVFHGRLNAPGLEEHLLSELNGVFRHLHAWVQGQEISLRVTKKGKIFLARTESAHTPEVPEHHDRQKNHLLQEGAAVPALADMGVFTKDGRVVASMRDKYRQINRFLEILDDAVDALGPRKRLSLVDFGCGKSYLTFVVYHYFTVLKGMEVSMVGLDLKKDVIAQCNRAAQTYGYDGLRFEVGDIRGYAARESVDAVISLHACDTATDYALDQAIGWGAELILAAPCCQHELAAQLREDALPLLSRYGIAKERFAALMTDALRANLLECSGYKTQLMEFVDLAHTPKNLLIRAVRRPRPEAMRAAARREVEETISRFGLTPTLYRLLAERGVLR